MRTSVKNGVIIRMVRKYLHPGMHVSMKCIGMRRIEIHQINSLSSAFNGVVLGFLSDQWSTSFLTFFILTFLFIDGLGGLICNPYLNCLFND